MTRWLKLAVAVVLLLVPLFFVDWRRTLAVMMTVTLLPLGLAAFALMLNMPLSSAKWNLLLRVQRIRPGFMNVLNAYWIGAFFSNYFPSTFGGDVVRLIVLKCGGRRAEAAASIVVERITGLLVLLPLCAFGLAARPEYFDLPGLFSFLCLLILSFLGGIVMALAFGDAFAHRLKRLIADRTGLGPKLVGTFAKVVNALAAYRQYPAALVVGLALSIPFYCVLVLFQYLILVAVGAPLPLIEVFFIAPMIPLISMIPVSVNGLGLVEGAFVLFYAQAGVLPEAAFAAAVLRRLLSLGVSLVGGVFWLGRARQRPAA